MDLDNMIKVWETAWDKFGPESQKQMAIEELAELIVAISHHMREREGSYDNVAEEIADTWIMLHQLMYGLGNQGIVQWWLKNKTKKLDQKLKACTND